MSQTEPESDHLSPKQARFVLCLLQGLSLNNTASIVGISYCTAKRWAKSLPVASALRDGTDELVARSQRDLLSKVSGAVAVLNEIAMNDAQPAQVRRQAASDIVNLALRSVADSDRRLIAEIKAEHEAIQGEIHAIRGTARPTFGAFGPGGSAVPGVGTVNE